MDATALSPVLPSALISCCCNPFFFHIPSWGQGTRGLRARPPDLLSIHAPRSLLPRPLPLTPTQATKQAEAGKLQDTTYRLPRPAWHDLPANGRGRLLLLFSIALLEQSSSSFASPSIPQSLALQSLSPLPHRFPMPHQRPTTITNRSANPTSTKPKSMTKTQNRNQNPNANFPAPLSLRM